MLGCNWFGIKKLCVFFGFDVVRMGVWNFIKFVLVILWWIEEIIWLCRMIFWWICFCCKLRKWYWRCVFLGYFWLLKIGSGSFFVEDCIFYLLMCILIWFVGRFLFIVLLVWVIIGFVIVIMFFVCMVFIVVKIVLLGLIMYWVIL